MYFVKLALLAASFFPSRKYSFIQQLKNAFRGGFRLLGIWIPNQVPGEFFVGFVARSLTLFYAWARFNKRGADDKGVPQFKCRAKV